jgi:hypothetical protein
MSCPEPHLPSALHGAETSKHRGVVRAVAYVRYWRKAFPSCGRGDAENPRLGLPIDLAHQPDQEASFGHISLVNAIDQSDIGKHERQGFMYLRTSANISDAAERCGTMAQRLLNYN